MNGSPLVLDGVQLRHPSDGVGNLSLKLEQGTALVVVGRNGAGKSTLLKTIAGLINPAGGRVLLSGSNVLDLPPSRRAHHLSFVASTPPRGTVMTVRDVIELALEAGGNEAHSAAVDAALTSGTISDWSNLPLDHLSDGMAQRVMLVRAFVQARDLVLMDEPTAFLDVVGRKETMEQIGEWMRRGKTVVLSTHDLEAVEAAGWANRWLLLRPPSQGGSTVMEQPFTSAAARRMLMGN